MTSPQRYLAPADFSAAETWRLVEWCRRVGADEFTVDYSGSDARPVAKVWRDFERTVAPYSRGKGIRERMSGPTADDLTRSTQLWELNQSTLDALKGAFSGGLLAYDPEDQGCFEDPVIYRDGHLLLGVLSHEAFALLRVSDLEAKELAAAGFPSHDSLPRVG